MLGLYLRPVPPGAYARLLHFLVHCPDIATALDEAGEFYRLFDGARPWTVEIAGPVARLRLTPRTDDQRQSLLYAHMMLLTAWQTAGWLGATEMPLRRVTLPDGFAGYADEARFLFGRMPEFGGEAALDWPRRVLAAPVTRRRDEIPGFLRRAPGGMTAPGQPATIEAQLRLMLAASDPFASLREDEAAGLLGLSRQTLARRLSALGTSYQAIRDALRRDRACALLARGDASLGQIAEITGYSEPSAFQRAFKQWTGLPPGDYRRRHRP
jgi:AraC-like DNA-binding protein